jgi:cation diffusion facilitator family transporter
MKSEHCRICRDEVIVWAVVVNIAQTTFKGVLGLMTGSAALIADSIHSGADVVASFVTMFSVKVSQRGSNEDYPFGYGNVQFISSSVVGLILIFGALYLMYESVMKIVTGTYAEPNILAVLGAVISIATNELMYRYQGCVGKENNSPAIIANAWDNRSDALSSVGVLIGISIAVMGFPIADVLAAFVVAILVARIGIELNVDAIDGLMDSSVDMDVLSEVYAIAKNTEHVVAVQHLRGRNVGEEIFLDICICVDGDLRVFESDLVADAVREKLLSDVEHVKDIQILVVPDEETKKPKGKSQIISLQKWLGKKEATT